MIRRGASLACVALAIGGCVYYNAIYNAEEAYRLAERHRQEGRDSAAAATYEDVVRKAARGYRAEPNGEWAPTALYLIGRAQLRMGDPRAARLAFEESLTRTTTRLDSLRIQAFLASAEWELGRGERALSLVNGSLRELQGGDALAEGHLLRARILLSRGEVDAGWWDLDRAVEADRSRRVESALERLGWAIRRDAPERAREAFGRLLSFPEAGVMLDTLRALTDRSAQQWGPATVAGFLQGGDSAAWARPEREQVRLLRSDLLFASGEREAAVSLATDVAEGLGAEAADARLRLVEWAVEAVQDLAGARAMRRILIPSSDDPVVAEALAAFDRIERFASLGLDDPLGWFAAAEIARDEVGAPILARGLFVAFVDAEPASPWAPKALLAALDASRQEGDRAWLRGRLEQYAESPYVRAARGEAAPGFEALEEELAARLMEMRVS